MAIVENTNNFLHRNIHQINEEFNTIFRMFKWDMNADDTTLASFTRDNIYS